jgi:Tetratricopeptide repeat
VAGHRPGGWPTPGSRRASTGWRSGGRDGRLRPLTDAAELRALGAEARLVRVLGPNHAEVAVLMNNLAVSLHRQGRGRAAGLMYRRALSAFEASLPEHPGAEACRANYRHLCEESRNRRQVSLWQRQ